MTMRRLPMVPPAGLAACGALACLVAAAPAGAADIQGHAITYQITVDKPPADMWVDGQLSVSLSKACDAWSYSSALVYGIERNMRGAREGRPLSNRADSYQEGIKFTEKLDGRQLQYEGRYHFNSRGEDTRGTVSLAEDGSGILDVKSDRLSRKVDLPAGTLLPLTLRGKLIDTLARLEPEKTLGPLGVRTIELGRFHTAADATLAQAAPLPALRVPKGETPRVVRSPLLSGRAWTLKQTSKALTDWMESTFELHQSGVIARFTFKRENIIWRADIRELNVFPNPKCGG